MKDKDVFTEGFIIPTLQGVSTGALFSLVTAGYMQISAPDAPPEAVVAISFGLVSSGVSLFLYNRWIDRYSPRKLAAVPAKSYAAESQRITVIDSEPRDYVRGQIIDLPEAIRPGQVRRAALLISHSGWSFSHALLAGANRPFTRQTYELFRDSVCFPKQWITWKNDLAHNQGLCVTRAGQNAFRFLSSPTPNRLVASH